MGDRAVVKFKSGDDNANAAVYLHWHGSVVPELLAGAAPRMRRDDPTYAMARFVGHCHNEIDGALSLGVGGVDDFNERTYVVDVSDGDVTLGDKVVANIGNLLYNG